jgi:CHAT domain-containing protein
LGRASFARPVRGHTPLNTGAPSIDYAIIGDSMFAWVDDGKRTRVTRLPVDRAALAMTIDRVNAALERDAPPSAWMNDLQHLYDLLIRPNVAVLGPVASLAIVAPEELANAPFSALLDRRSGRFLVEDHAIRIASSLADLSRPPRASSRTTHRAIFVADPPLDRRLFPALDPLPGAAREIDSASMAYPVRHVLRGSAADSAATVRASSDASVFHFAGHAVFDANQPERSYLAIGPRGLRASAIATLDLRHLQLAVLSACETGRATWTRSADAAGLADAFLTAGARGVVAAQWRTNDARTLRLMQSLHRGFASGVDAASALRGAQLELLHSRDSRLAAPSTWGAFTYRGQ